MKKPTPPTEARERPPRPGGLPRVEGEDGIVIPSSEFYRILKELRTNKLLGPAAADALEVAAGLVEASSPQSPQAVELRSKVASARDADDTDAVKVKPKKKAMMFAAEEPEEIPEEEVKEEAVAEEEEPPPQEAEDEPELNLNPKQNKMRTDLEMWVMDEIPVLFGVDDSEELDEKLQEDGQALKITQLIAETDADKQRAKLLAWLEGSREDQKEEFISTILQKVVSIHDAGAKKKKKKKKKEED